jgi:hypothetical protein
MLALLTQNKPKLYKKAFHNVMVIMPPSSRHSLKDDPFEGLSEEKVFDDLTPEALMAVETMAKGYMQQNKFSLLFIDDMAAALKDGNLLKGFNRLVNNRRHLRLSIWCVVQTYKSIPLSNRRTITHMLCFKPNNRTEGEAISKELVLMNPVEWDAYTTHAFGAGAPHSFLFLDVDRQTVYDQEFRQLQCVGAHDPCQNVERDEQDTPCAQPAP